MHRTMTAALGAGLLTLAATGAGAATVVDTGAGTAAPNFAAIGFQSYSYGQFTLSDDTEITGIEFYGTVATAGRASFALFYSDAGNTRHGTPIYTDLGQQIAASPLSPGWFGKTNITGVTLTAGTWWVGSASDGLFTAVQYGSAPNGLIHEEVLLPTGTSLNNDSLNLSWRISGNVLRAPAPAVPEPATWAMMIAGFALMAFQFRHRREFVPV